MGLWVFLSADPARTQSADPKAKYAPSPASASVPSPASASAPAPAPNIPSLFSHSAQRKRRQIFSTVTGDQAFTRLKEPEFGDWLRSFKEPGQTLEEYAVTTQNRKTASRHTLHFRPFSDLSRIQKKTIGPIKEYLQIFFDVKVEQLPQRSVQKKYYHRGRRQYHAEKIIYELAEKVPANSLGLFGLMGSDLYVDDLNFVFGVAYLQKRASLQSLNRFGTKKHPLLSRALKLVAHEIGHMFGLDHCVFYECVMNGTNSLSETDRRPHHLCPVCIAKLHSNIRFDPAMRYQKLAAYFKKEGFREEAAFCKRAQIALTEAP